MSFADRYGERPLHLIAGIATLAIVGYAFLEIFERPSPIGFLVWFGAAIALHDLISFPIYSLLNAVAGRAAAGGGSGPHASWLNYVRVPTFLAGLAFLAWFPLILGKGKPTFEAASGRTDVPFLERWLLLTAALFVISGLLYAIQARRRGHSPSEPPASPGGRVSDAPGQG